jgi:hypothetical protein
MHRLLSETGRTTGRNTPTAGAALSIDANVQVVQDQGGQLFLETNITTSNGALTDNGTGCAKLALLSGGAPVSRFIACSPQNPGKGFPWNGNTVRSGGQRFQVPSGVSFDQIGFSFYNKEHDVEQINIDNLITIGAALLAG